MVLADASGFILFPLVVHSFDLVVSAIGIASIKSTRDPSSKSVVEDPMVILQKGYSITLGLAVVAFTGVSSSHCRNQRLINIVLPLLEVCTTILLTRMLCEIVQSTRWLLYTEQAPSAWIHFALCGLVGIITAYSFVWISQYYTDYKYEPVRTLALASTSGHGTNIIAGITFFTSMSNARL